MNGPRPNGSLTLTMKNEDLLDQLADALADNVFDVSGYRQDVTIDVESLISLDDGTWEMQFVINVEEIE